MIDLWKIRDNFHSFRDVFLLLRIFLFAAILPFLIKFIKMQQLIYFLNIKSANNRNYLEDKIVKYTDYILTRNFMFCKKTCLNRSIILYRFLNKAGIKVTLNIGIKRVLSGSKKTDLQGHAWLTCNDNYYAESVPQETKSYIKTYEYAPATDIKAKFHLNNTDITALNLRALEDIKEIIRILNLYDIDVIPLKGIALILQYPNYVSERVLTDIDVLVDKRKIRNAENALKENGYIYETTNKATHVTYYKPGHLPIEIHWDLVNYLNPLQKHAFGVKLDNIWENAQQMSVDDLKFNLMRPEHMIIHLSMHMIKEFHISKKWINDIKLLIKKEKPINWHRLVKTAQLWGCLPCVYHALKVISMDSEYLIPESIMKKATSYKFPSWHNWLLNRISRELSIRHLRILLYFSVMPEIKNRLKSFLHLLIYVLKTRGCSDRVVS